MLQSLRRLLLVMALAGAAPAAAEPPAPPVAAMRPFDVLSPNGARSDPYYWLRDDTRKDPQMLDYLKAENAYADAVLLAQKPLARALFGEITARVAPDESTVPAFRRGYWYYTRFSKGEDYPVYARRAKSLSAPEEVMLDGPALSRGRGFFQIGEAVVSQDGRRLAYAEDDVGRRQYVLRIKDLRTGALLPDEIANVQPTLVWSEDGRTVFYIEKDPVTLLSKRLKAHVLGAPAAADKVVYEEADPSFYMGVARTRDDRFICIEVRSTTEAEQRCAPADGGAPFRPLLARARDHLYEADHLDGRWVIRTNWAAPNYRLMSLKDGAPWGDRDLWRPVAAARSDVFIEDILLFHGLIVTEERSGGLKRLRLRPERGAERFVAADEPAYAMSFAANLDPGAKSLNYAYESLTTPKTTYRLDLATGAKTLLQRAPAPGWRPQSYVTERVWITVRDGTRVPVSLAYKKGFVKNGRAALLQYGYGSYGVSTDPRFSPAVAALLDRGLVYAIAHIRGGQELGRAWYDQGRLLEKRNSFTDFIDVTRGLTALGYAAKDRVAAQGGSAGGLLMGAVANMAPEDYRVIIAQVPFVDVVTTMLDESIPLTTNEYDEWGDPRTKPAYDYMRSYSPYDNVEAKAYPAMFVTTGLFDSQVQYFEPTKWVAKLRALKTNDAPLVLRVNMQAGHGGKSGRLQRYEDMAEIYAFMLTELSAGA